MKAHFLFLYIRNIKSNIRIKMSERIKFSQEELALLSQYTDSENITDILTKFGGDIDKLKSYVKWIYKYGGTGSKGGNGSGGNGANWSILCTLDNKQTGSTIILSESNNNKYPIKLSINRPGSDTYTCAIYVNGKQQGKNFILSAENNLYESTVSITNNYDVRVDVKNNNEDETKQVITKCILFPHNLSYAFMNNNNEQFVDPTTIFYKNLTNGLKLRINHNIYVDATNVQLNINIIGQKNYAPINIKLTNNAYNPETNNPYTYIDLWDILELSLGDDRIFGTYSISCKLSYNYNGNNETSFFINTTIIPEGLYLKIVPTIQNATMYRSQQRYTQEEIDAAVEGDEAYGKNVGDIKDSAYKFTTKNIGLSLTAYTTLSTVQVDIKNNGKNVYSGLTLRQGIPSMVSVQLVNTTQDFEEYKLDFSVIGESEVPKVYEYYIYLAPDSGELNWYDNDLLVTNESYFRGTDGPYKNISLDVLQSINRNFIGQGFIQMNMIGENSSIKLYEESDIQLDTTHTDLLLSFGIQYSEVNSDLSNIFELIFDNGAGDVKVQITQNKIIIGEKSAEIFIPKETDFDVMDNSKYHLFNILIRNVETENVDQRKYEMIIYIDGFIEKGISSYFGTSQKMVLKSINVFEGNYSLNLLDVAYIYFADITQGNRSITDADVTQYYYKYMSSDIDNDEISYFVTLKNIVQQFKYEEITDQSSTVTVIKVDGINTLKDLKDKLLDNGRINHNVPLIILNMNYDGTPEQFMKDYFCKSYSEGALGNVDSINIANFTYIDSNGKDTDCSVNSTFKLQGSSTGQFKSKNFTLQIQNPQGIDNTYVTLFTPNFDHNNTKEANNSFLPENLLLFKADAVDSTHANNTSAGLFINENTTPFSDSRNIHTNAESYKRYIKNCLTGFPLLVFFGLPDKDNNDKIHYYYMGIYNCNLGRDSVVNLGYYNIGAILNNLYEINGTTQVNLLDETGKYDGFGVYVTHIENYQPMNGLCVAEIQGGNPYYDFSQFDSTILFEDRENNEGMFGDFYPKGENIQRQKQKIQTFVREVSLFGGKLFTLLEKNMSTDELNHYGYDLSYKAHLSDRPYYVPGSNNWITRSTGSVPNYKKQFTRFGNNFTYSEELSNIFGEAIDNINSNWQDPFRHFVGIFNEEETQEEYEYKDTDALFSKYFYLLDYTSLVEYYTLCMAFGLTDSVQKNMNIKSFREGGPFYTAFYDMDTSFSRDNGGVYVHPFAFSDYWTMEDDNAVIYRDFYPNTELASKASQFNINIMEKDWGNIPLGFDIPSSYLFAIAKYAKVFYNNKEDSRYKTNPSYYWYTLRKDNNSELRNSKYFIENYFGRNLNKINRLFFNANYRFKYLQKTSTGFDVTNITPFHGRGLASLEDWLNKRFHILDAYFNITNVKTNNYKHYDISTNTWKDLQNNGVNIYDPLFEDVANIVYALPTNEDVHMIRSIFGTGMGYQKYSGGQVGTISIHALDYSPIYNSYSQGRYLQFICIDPQTEYQFTVPNDSGSQTIGFGGSISWTNVASFNTLINSDGVLYINSPYLENISVTNNVLKELQLPNIPSVKTIEITSPEAACQLNLVNENETVNTYPNLRTINISNSKCGLTAKGLDITTINAQNINSPNNNIIVQNCNNLRSCNFSGSSLKSIELLSIWNKDITIANSNISNISITNSKFDNASITIVNDLTVSNITLVGFEKITISNCPNIKNITLINGSEENFIVKSIKIISCCGYLEDGEYPTFTICGKSSEQVSDSNIKVDLSNVNQLEEISFEGTKYIDTIILPDKEEITLSPYAFANTNLRNINYIQDNDNHFLCITHRADSNNRYAAGTFYNSKFNFTQNFTLRVKKPNTSLASIFEIGKFSSYGDHTGQAALSYDDLYDLITNLDGKENVVSLENAFYRQENITFTFSGLTMQYSSNKHLSLAGYTNLLSCKNMLWGTGYNVIDDKLFGINNEGDITVSANITSPNVLNIDNIIGTLTYVHEDALKYIKNKISNFLYSTSPGELDGNNRPFISYNTRTQMYNDSELLAEVNVHKFLFNDDDNDTITSISGISFNNATTNLDGLFTEHQNNVTTIVCSFNNLIQSTVKNNSLISASFVKGFNNIGLSNVNNNLTIYRSFTSIDTVDMVKYIPIDNLVDIASFISYGRQYNNLINNSQNKYNESNISNIFNFYKKIDYSNLDNWNTLWYSLATQSNLSYLFSKTTFIFNSNSNDDCLIKLPESLNEFESTTKVNGLFSNCTGKLQNNEEVGICISKETLIKFKNIENISNLFANSTFNGINGYPLPEDIFDIDDNKFTNISNMFNNVKIIGTHKTYNNTSLQKSVYYKYDINHATDTKYNVSISNYKFTDENYTNNVQYGYPIIPPTLFNEKCKNVSEIQGIFGDSDFEGYIPSNLFDNLTKLTNINKLFNKCKILPQKLTTIDSSVINDKIYKLGNYQTDIYSLYPENFIDIDTNKSISSIDIFNVYAIVGENTAKRIYLFNDHTFISSSNRTNNLTILNFNVEIHSQSLLTTKIITNSDNQPVLFDLTENILNNTYIPVFNICFNFNDGIPTNYSEGIKVESLGIKFDNLSNSILSQEMAEIYYGYILEKGSFLNVSNHFNQPRTEYLGNFGRQLSYNASTKMIYPSNNIMFPTIIKYDSIIPTTMYPNQYINKNVNELINRYKYDGLINVLCDLWTIRELQIDIDDTFSHETVTNTETGNADHLYTFNDGYQIKYEQELTEDVIKTLHHNIVYSNYLLLFNNWYKSIIGENGRFTLETYHSLRIFNESTNKLITVNNITISQPDVAESLAITYSCRVEQNKDNLIIREITAN